MISTKLWIVIVAIVILSILYWKKEMGIFPEKFGSDGYTFLPYDADERYGLRGDLLNRRHIINKYIDAKSHMAINRSGGIMWEDDHPPREYGITNCDSKISCPDNFRARGGSTCWQCELNGEKK
jgi:hypothetical protein